MVVSEETPTAERRPPARPGRARGVGIPAAVGAVGVLAAAVTGGGADRMGVATLLVGAAWVLAASSAHRAGRSSLAALAAVLAVAHAAVACWPVLTPALIGCWFAVTLALPAGGGLRGGRLALACAALLGGLGWSAVTATTATAPAAGWTLAAAAAVTVAAAIGIFVGCRSADAAGRRLLQWLAAGTVVTAAAAAVLLALTALVGSPGQPVPWIVGALALVPLSVALGVHPGSAPGGPTALVEAVVTAGLAVLVVVVYLVVVIGLGRAPVDQERDVLTASIVAAIVVAVLALPVRARLVATAAALVGRDSRDGGDEMASFGSRMTRAVPMDELLLQLAESLRATLAPAGAEVWVGTDGALDRTVAVPDRPALHLQLGEHERVVVGRARSGGARWMSVWLPDRLAEHVERHGPDAPIRAVPVAHLGSLLGLLVLHRADGADPFTEEEERTLVELARQLGLALHNVRLDSALQASLEELQRRNAELQASRLRIVTAADESRRAIERDLHDGAQQHLVALAVKIGLAKMVAGADPSALPDLLDQLRADAQAAIGAVRELAHGIYPPLLRDRGLGEALRTAATRSPLRCAVEVDLPGRYSPDVEACVYFCCLEAVQNAGKHAGPAAEILVRITAPDTGAGPDPGTAADATGELRFEVTDDGAGFDADAGSGHGFVNMRDRLGAVGGELEVRSAPGAGTTIAGRLPAAPRTNGDRT